MREIDVLFQGVPRSICTLEHEGVLVDPGPESCFDTLLDALDEAPRHVLLTHIHFDHAGAAGALCERFPDVEVWVHEKGAPHLVDPTRLVSSARRLYGEQFDPLWGRVVPVPEERLHVLSGAEGTATDGWVWAYAPGHAQHHVAFLHEPTRRVYAGDVAGVRIDDGPVSPPTPPPDIDPPTWHRSIDLIEAWAPSAVTLTHFGMRTDVADHLGRLRQELDRWARRAREADEATFVAEIQASLEASTASPETLAAYAKANPPSTLYAGLARYWKLVDEGRLGA